MRPLDSQVPTERWRQGAALFDDNTMIVYGGYSQRCGDYCDDVWSFDLRDNTWMEIYPLGHFAEGLDVIKHALCFSQCMWPSSIGTGFPTIRSLIHVGGGWFSNYTYPILFNRDI